MTNKLYGCAFILYGITLATTAILALWVAVELAKEVIRGD